jgi:hypothetical protein
MTNSWTNADGEPIMDGAAWRFEQQLDAEYEPDPYHDDYCGECDEPDECDHDGTEKTSDGWVCSWCGEPVETPEWDCDELLATAEDAWLDGSYEE